MDKIPSSITDRLFTQLVELVGNDNNQKKMKLYVIDPLVQYFKHKLGTFFIIVIILLCCILVVNLVMIGYFMNLKALLKVNLMNINTV